jgi:tetratricopeptide (TPR) repeat protein
MLSRDGMTALLALPAARRIAGVALLLAACMVVYWPALRGEFVWDDRMNIVENEAVRSPGGLATIWAEPGAQPQYFPLTYSLFWLEHRFFGLETGGYHLVNVLLHGVTAFLLWMALGRLGLAAAFPAALFFAVHPVQVESVAWITELKNVLSGVFFAGSLLAWLAASSGPGGERPPPGRPARVAAFLLFTLGMLAKTSGMGLPLVFLGLAWWSRGRVTRDDLVRVAPFAAVSAVLPLAVLWRERVDVVLDHRFFELSLLHRILLAGRVFWFYLARIILPGRFSFIYPRWSIDPTALPDWFPLLAAVALFVLLWRLSGRLGRGPLTALASFAVMIAPFLGLVPFYFNRYSYVADHFVYLGAAPVLGLVVAAMERTIRKAFPSRPARWLTTGLWCLVAIGLGLSARTRAGVFAGQELLWRDTIAANPSALMAYNNLGNHLLESGRVEEAVGEFGKLLARDPAYPGGNYNLGNALVAAGREAEAEEAFRREIRRYPGNVEAMNNLGTLLVRMDRPTAAVDVLAAAASARPLDSGILTNLGFALLLAGRREEATRTFVRALELDPGNVKARAGLGF